MIEGGNFNITNTSKPTNTDLVVAFSPAANIKSYTYTIYKDNQVYQTQNINNNQTININLIETGTYQIFVKALNTENKEISVNSGTYIIDKEAPVITVTNSSVQLKKGDILPNNIITAKDNYTVTPTITTNDIDLSTSGTKTLTYTVTDEAGNTAYQNININVLDNQFYLYTIQLIILVLFVMIVYIIARFQRSIKLIKRIEPFTIEPLKSRDPSVFDKAFLWYQSKLNKITKIFDNSVIIKKYGKRLDKYKAVSTVHQNGEEIFISKIVVSVIFIIIAIITKALQFKLLSAYELFLPLLVGFFLLDIVYFIKYKLYRNKLENDLLAAIIVMNNAFKAGRSITQAIDIVSKEVKGEIGREFSKMSLELSYGLGIDVVFKRFAQRIKLDEVNYLTASLTILNKTGGNIIEVFSSIEKTLFNKKKLRLELKSLTASSRIIVYVLFTVPFLFIIFVSIISPGYFNPFITTDIGRIILVIMIIYYILFIFSVRKIMKVVI